MTETTAAAPNLVSVYDDYRRTTWLTKLKRFGRGCLRNPVASVAGVFLVAEMILVLPGIVDTAAPYSPLKTDLLNRLHGPSSDHLFGTDSVGRDQFSRILFGAQTSLAIAALAVTMGMVIGTIIGLTTGYLGGLFDQIFQRLIDTLQAFPALIMAMLLISVFGQGRGVTLIPGLVDLPGKYNVVLPIVVIFIPYSSRVVRASVLTLRNRDFVLAGQTIGATPARIMFRHILPNAMAPILVMASLLFGAAILVEASLSFLGLGAQPPEPSLGGILSQEGRPQLALHPYLAVVPAVVISITVLSINIIGDTLRDILDPSLRGRI